MLHGVLMYMWLIGLFTMIIVIPMYLFGLLCLIVASIVDRIQNGHW